MRFADRELSYCSNVHPGERLEDLHQILKEGVSAVKALVSPQAPFGLGLRLGHQICRQLSSQPAALERLAEQMQSEDLYLFTVNGFPYGDFSAQVVKERVYAPDWRSPERLKYSLALAQVISALPGPSERSLSTVAGGFKPLIDAAGRALIRRQLITAARGLADLAQGSGTAVRLCLEPEPWTMLESTEEVLEFFRELPDEAPVREHLGLCFDCCHQALGFEDLVESLQRLKSEGVTVGKIQISSALHLDNPRDEIARAELLRFQEPRYLHQVVGRRPDGSLLKVLDLPELMEPSPDWLEAEAWRCHFHLPIDWRGQGRLKSTRSDWEAAVLNSDSPHLEVETYTWGLLPKPPEKLSEGIAEELRALMGVLESGP